MSDELTIGLIIYVLLIAIAIYFINKNQKKTKDEIRKLF